MGEKQRAFKGAENINAPEAVFYQDKIFHKLFVNSHDLYSPSSKLMKPVIKKYAKYI